jgi:ABC-type nickel/cobalt efflux system permease component RcnA
VPLASALAVALLLAAAGPALAHPLGNFTINVYGGIVVRSEGVVVDYVVDMAEIPAFQERARIDLNGDGHIDATERTSYRNRRCAQLAAGLTVELDGTPLELATDTSALSFPPGAGGLSTLRLECRLLAQGRVVESSVALTYDDENFVGRIGWREVTAVGDATTIVASDVPSESQTDRLTSYPRDASPLDVTAARVEVVPGGPRLPALPWKGRGAVATPAPGRDGGVLTAFAGNTELSIGLVALMLVVALGVGALHALGPGHGKGLIGAYLMGRGGTLRQAVAVGGAVSVMHTASVLGLGVLVVSAERLLPPERIYPWMGLASGLVALALGSWLLMSRIHAAGWRHGLGHLGNRGHVHHHEHPHPHPPADEPLSRRGLMALAIAGGILPSPSALVVLLTSISLGRTALGLALIAAFSVGLAGSLVAIGVLALHARSLATRRMPTRIVAWAPVGSAAAIAVFGLILTTRGLFQI